MTRRWGRTARRGSGCRIRSRASWNSGNWIGVKIPASSPGLSTMLVTVLSPVMYLKISTPLTMLLLGLSAWVLFRQLKFSAMASVAGGLAAGLNMHCFSNACWGTGTWNIAMAMIFLAVAALVSDAIRQTWMKAALAGLAVGMAVMEGFDSGAILSVYAGVFVVFYYWISEPRTARGVWRGLGAGILVVVFAVWIAASTLSTLVGTSIKGVAGMGQTAEEKQERWLGATMWSLPKLETLRVIVPGLVWLSAGGLRHDAGAVRGVLGQGGGRPAHHGAGEQRRGDAGEDGRGAWIAAGGSEYTARRGRPGARSGGGQCCAAAFGAEVRSAAASHRVGRIRRGAGVCAGVVRADEHVAARPAAISQEGAADGLVLGFGGAVLAGGGLGSLFVSLRVALQAPVFLDHPQSDEVHAPVSFGVDHPGRVRAGGAVAAAPGKRRARGGGRGGEKKPFTVFEKWWLGGLVLTAVAAGLAYWNYGAGNSGTSQRALERLAQCTGAPGF